MKAPNHVVPVRVTYSTPFPLLKITTEDEPPGFRYRKPIFYDTQYGEPSFDYPAYDVPPTWMDPMIFVQMARQDPEIVEILKQRKERNKR
jgi:hypothetical protein